MSKIIVVFALILSFPCISQEYETGETLFVWNMEGTSLITDPLNPTSTIELLGYATRILIVDDQLRTKPYEKILKDSIALKGYWVMVKSGDNVGYVFDGDCSTKSSFIKSTFERTIILTTRFLGAKIDFKEETRNVLIDEEEFRVIDKITTYQNGEYKFTFDGDDCFEHLHTFQSITFNEVYQLMINIHIEKYRTGDGWINGKPTLINIENGVYKFTGTEATGEIQIRVKEETIELYSYECT